MIKYAIDDHFDVKKDKVDEYDKDINVDQKQSGIS